MHFTWTSAMMTHAGNVRAVNEDACAEYPDRGIWLVADGMGGHRAGDVASRRVVEVVGSLQRATAPGEFLDRLEDGLIAVNSELLQAVDGADGATMGSTVVVLYAFSRWTLCIWAGDSRVYRLSPAGELEQVTRDHSQVEEMVELGELRREEAQHHPQANVITRAVGGAHDLMLDLDLRELADGDRYMLCSDGLFKDLEREEIARLLPGGGCADACERLLSAALAREAADNITVGVVDFHRADD